MASKRAKRRKSCTRKKRHDTQEQAMAAKKNSSFGRGLTPYKCKFCGGYHLGHPPKNVRQSMADKGKR